MVVDILKIVSQLSGLTILIFISLLLQDLYLSKNKLHPGRENTRDFHGKAPRFLRIQPSSGLEIRVIQPTALHCLKSFKGLFHKSFSHKDFQFSRQPKKLSSIKSFDINGKETYFHFELKTFNTFCLWVKLSKITVLIN